VIEFKVGYSYVNVIADEDETAHIYHVLNYREPGFAAIRDRMLRLNPRNPYWRTYDGIKSLYDNHNKRFLSGLLPKVGAYLTERHIDYVITCT
jgi:hypothetical protein